MEKKSEVMESKCAIYELPGEPAVVIDGMPDTEVNPNSDALVLSNVKKEDNVQSERDKGCGEWLEGREVQKLFGEKFYHGSVIQFDKETGWYRVEYEDGDAEDLDWPELEEVLMPVDITTPLRTLALKLLKKDQKASIVKPESGEPVDTVAKSAGKKGKMSEAQEKSLI